MARAAGHRAVLDSQSDPDADRTCHIEDSIGMAALSQHQEPMKSILVVGLGISGYSVIRHLARQPVRLTVADTREIPPYLNSLKKHYPDASLITGRIPLENLEEFDEIVASPGIELPASAMAGKLVGDIELFARAVEAPVIGITGSNGKSTVTMLVRDMLLAAGKQVLAGGNLGTPALDLLEQERPDFYVLELSSFQLETVRSLRLAAAAILNISEDHLDRHKTIQAYTEAKLRIFRNAEQAVVNCDDAHLRRISPRALNSIGFGLQTTGQDCEFGILVQDGTRTLVHGNRKLVREDQLRIQGDSHILNVLSGLALVHASGVKLDDSVIQAAANFRGLPHRCQLVGEYGGIEWINDSKATNTGATKAAIMNFSKPIILIAGGQGKGADFRSLGLLIEQKVRHVILIGEDAKVIDAALSERTERSNAFSLEQAVEMAARLAGPGEAVLFSPACASYDMFESYIHRGDAFTEIVARRARS
ncbi:MAG: UDP-N-acetylmuramoyl-L-alanine--D-glutamate ligase [Gammaproteobacteria bacterium]|nr:UDP-N-acetylmuramoyl-L-alanine--D-glutamate ligase [Gammaproteobacteria bacterium]MCY4228223.1 UDP-N-acetylmuramoyl-L-alanine--D-glutamate ligase [Gammaproteobacteria bacterium]